MESNIFKIGPIRPPSEANSLLLRVTENCSWNKCKFCMLYKKTSFRTRPVEDVLHDIDVMAEYRDRILANKIDGEFNMQAINNEFFALASDDERMCYQMVFTWLTEGASKAIFLQDANTMVLQADKLVPIVAHITELFPEIDRITSYGRADTLSRITPEDYKRLYDAGLNRIHSGFESGSDRVLTLIGKGTTQEQQIIAGKKIKDAGIELSIYFMPGVGGMELSDENAVETAKVINEVSPDFVRLRTFVLRSGSLMEEVRDAGNYTEATDIEKLVEIRKMIAHIDPTRAHGRIASDHIINLLQQVEGEMDNDIDWMLAYIDEYLALPQKDQRRYQLARRMGFPLDWKQLYRLKDTDAKRIDDLVKNVYDTKEWEALIHQFVDRYI